jgi:hypothetical protein
MFSSPPGILTSISNAVNLSSFTHLHQPRMIFMSDAKLSLVTCSPSQRSMVVVLDFSRNRSAIAYKQASDMNISREYDVACL